MLIRIYILWET